MQEHVTPTAYAVVAGGKANPSDSSFINYHDIKRFVKRYAKTIAIATVLGILAAAAYAYSSVPLYTARTQIIIDPSLPQTMHDSRSEGIFSIDNAQVESQLEILRSEKIGQAVIDRLKLKENPEFMGGSPSLLSSLLGLFRSGGMGPVDEFVLDRVTLARLLGGLSVRRVGLSYSIDIQYSSRSPELAAKIANALAEAYINEQIAARAQAARQGGLWLEERIDQLRKEMNKSALDAQEFRAKRDYRLAPTRGGAEPEAGAQASAQDDKAARDKETRDARAARADRHNTMEELDSTAQTYRRIYESYLMAYTESVQKQSYPVTNARVITAATTPLVKSHPRTKLLLAFGGLMGCLVGFGIAFFRHSIDGSVTGARQIREEVGMECVASIPLLPPSVARQSMARTMLAKGALGEMMKRLAENPSSILSAGVSLAKSLKASAASESDDALSAVVTMPFTNFSHGIKMLKTAISLAGRTRHIHCLAITSALPNEGKTTIAANLATLFALSGVKTLLVDADLRNASLTRALAPTAELGLIEAISGKAGLKKCIVAANGSGLDLLPASDIAHAAHSDEILGSEKARSLLQELQKTYDMVIFELPPLTATLDGLAISSMLDSTLLVAEWGKTPVPVLSEAVRLLRSAHADILGVALNKVDTSTLQYGDVAGNYRYGPQSAAMLRRRA
jgi:capsular exopolysaccharide synthesis family protein